MLMSGHRRLAWICAPALLGGAYPAFAEELHEPTTNEVEPAIEIDLSVTLVSDYRWRGVSASDKEPAIQPELTIGHKSGVYLNLWGSNVADNGGSDVELDVSLGFAGSLGKLDYDVAAAWYTYPGASQYNYVELIGSLETKVGAASIGTEIAYAPRQDNIGGRDNLYVAVNGQVPIPRTPLSLAGSLGIEDGAFGDSKIDWSVGVSADLAGFTLGASYVDTARAVGDPLAKATVVASAARTF